jgi:hypothetical protein
MSHARTRTERCARSSAASTAEKYSSPSISTAARSAFRVLSLTAARRDTDIAHATVVVSA